EVEASLEDGPSQPATNDNDGFTLVTNRSARRANSAAVQQHNTHRVIYTPEQLKAMRKRRDDFNKSRALNLATLDAIEAKCLISVVRTGERTAETARALNRAARVAGAVYQEKRTMQGDVFAVDPQIKVEAINSLCNQGYMAFDVSQYCEWLKKSELDQLALIVTVPEVPGEKATQLAKTLVQRDSDLNVNSVMFYTLPAAPSEENPSGK
ncbi:MAG: hypothetical protein MI748_05685, partial [Opitutales bacterium]|nr:hypothetical protein [Opitutales bacterium]